MKYNTIYTHIKHLEHKLGTCTAYISLLTSTSSNSECFDFGMAGVVADTEGGHVRIIALLFHNNIKQSAIPE